MARSIFARTTERTACTSATCILKGQSINQLVKAGKNYSILKCT